MGECLVSSRIIQEYSSLQRAVFLINTEGDMWQSKRDRRAQHNSLCDSLLTISMTQKSGVPHYSQEEDLCGLLCSLGYLC